VGCCHNGNLHAHHLAHVNFFDQASLILVYLLGVVVIAARYGKRPAILSSILSVLLFDFFFVPPRYSLEVTNPQDLITLLLCSWSHY